MMAKEPADRPSTAQVDRELGQVLTQLLNPRPPARPAPRAATVLMRPDILPSEDDTIPVVRLKANQVRLEAPQPAAEPLGNGALPAGEPWPPLVDRKRHPPAAPAADAGVAPLVKRTASGSAQLVALSPARKGLRSSLLTAPGALLVLYWVVIKLSYKPPDFPFDPPPSPLGVSWVIRSTPAGANVYADDDRNHPLGQTPFVYQDPKHPIKKLVFSLPGHIERSISPNWKDVSPIAVKFRQAKSVKNPKKPAQPAPNTEPRMNSNLTLKVLRRHRG